MIKKTTKIFIEEASIVHNNKYDYSKTIYNGAHKKVIIICPIHKEFSQYAGGHLQKHGCTKCTIDKSKKNYTKKLETFIEEANDRHDCKYDYSKTIYKNSMTKIKVICKKHGMFDTYPFSHIDKRGIGCPTCKLSKGELEILKFLKLNNIKYIQQYKFEECRNKNTLLFDFYLPNLNICIEYDGEQHYKEKDFFGGNEGFCKIIKNDQIKNDFCMINNIQLLRISYKENIFEKLKVINI